MHVFDPTQRGNPEFETFVSFSLSFNNVPRVRIHGVLVHYTGLGLNITAPTDGELQNTLDVVNRMYPTTAFDYSGFTVIDFADNLAAVGVGGSCGPGWDALLSVLANMRSTSNTTDVYVGLLPFGVPTWGVVGCGGGGVAAGYINQGPLLAQEIAHAFGRLHAPCGGPASVDSSYPTYGSYPSGSIGEFGLDALNFRVWDPSTTFDFMSYCAPRWVSPHTYTGLKNSITSSAAAVSAAQPASRQFLYLTFRVHLDRTVEIVSGFHLEGRAIPSTNEEPSEVGCELIGSDGKRITFHRCHRAPHQSIDGEYLQFHETLEWYESTKAIAFFSEGERIDVFEVERFPPEIAVKEPRRVDGDTMRIEWSVERLESGEVSTGISCLVQYSNNKGKSWRTKAALIAGPHYDLDLTMLPGGEDCRARVVVSAGVRTAVAEIISFAVPIKPVHARIVAPVDGDQINSGDQLRLHGVGFSPDFGTTRSEDLVWTSTRDGLLGAGFETFIPNLSAGRHQIELTIPDGMGGKSVASVSVEVLPS
jgi:hypothetical protein